MNRSATHFLNARNFLQELREDYDTAYNTFVGRADEVFKASDYRISPFELESALIEFVTELPKTISRKIRRVQLRAQELAMRSGTGRGEYEHFEEDFPQLRNQENGKDI